jgi:hypothetical protein
VEIATVKLERETEKAAQYVLADSGGRMWFPKSVIEKADRMDDGTAILTVKRWFAAKEGLVDG